MTHCRLAFISYSTFRSLLRSVTDTTNKASMEKIRKRKLSNSISQINASGANAAMSKRTADDESARVQESEGRVLRSRPGRKILETELAGKLSAAAAAAVRSDNSLKTPKISLKGAYSPSDASAALASPSITAPGAPKRRSTKSRSSSDVPRLNTPNGAEISDVPAPATPPIMAGPNTEVVLGTVTAFPVWTREVMGIAMEHLCAVDSLLAPLVREHELPEKLLPTHTDSAFHSLAHIIISQQLSTAVADTMATKVREACGGAHTLEAEAVLALSVEELRKCGLSGNKTNFILGLAERFRDGQLTTAGIVAMDDRALYEQLTAVKGIGKWSVDMFAMFHAGRRDILPTGDLAVRKGFQALYGLKATPTDEQMEAIAEKWRPYRSLGSYYMWRVPRPAQIKKSKSVPVGVAL